MSNKVLDIPPAYYRDLKSDIYEEVTKYEDVKDTTDKEYFKGNQFSIDAFKNVIVHPIQVG